MILLFSESGDARRSGKKVLLYLLSFVGAVLVLGGGAVGIWMLVTAEERPEGEPSPEADAMAREMMEAVDVEAWNELDAVAWRFGGRRSHVWDKDRGLALVSFDDVEVVMNVHDKSGVARRGGEVVEGAEADELIQTAWKHWVNDSFWLNPIAKLFDPGTERAIVEWEGQQALMVTYDSGGVTPGDAYVWVVDDDHRPTAWYMWVSIIPVGGVKATWEGWKKLPGGAEVATYHELSAVTLELEDVRAADDVAELTEGDDPFASLSDKAPASAPTSRPSE